MELITGIAVGGGILYVAVTGFWTQRKTTARIVKERRRRYIHRVEPEVLDKMPEVWVSEAEDDFEARKDHNSRVAETQRQRDLGMIRRSGT